MDISLQRYVILIFLCRYATKILKHQPGIWLSPTPDQKPVFTLVGSTNLAARSAELDVELSFGVLTHSDALRSSLLDEVTGLRKYAVPWRGAEREVSFGTKVLVGMVGGML
jgi:CDP-diacylglycerol---glycerol-3-phosphate 3-phosphatidyltransferase